MTATPGAQNGSSGGRLPTTGATPPPAARSMENPMTLPDNFTVSSDSSAGVVTVVVTG